MLLRWHNKCVRQVGIEGHLRCSTHVEVQQKVSLCRNMPFRPPSVTQGLPFIVSKHRVLAPVDHKTATAPLLATACVWVFERGNPLFYLLASNRLV